MALSDLYANLNLLLRWLHVIFGITWLGLLYFFNFVNVPMLAVLDDTGKRIVSSQLMPRALWWFRWGAKFALLAGLGLFMMNYMYAPGAGFGSSPLMRDAEGLTGRAQWIMFGMTLGIIMWIIVWFIIWPAQKKMLRGKVAADLIPGLRRRVFLVSRFNAYLSGPMLFGMLAPAHYGAFNMVTVVVVSAVGVLVIWLAVKASSSVGASA